MILRYDVAENCMEDINHVSQKLDEHTGYHD